jgi:hypothetical protein
MMTFGVSIGRFAGRGLPWRPPKLLPCSSIELPQFKIDGVWFLAGR